MRCIVVCKLSNWQKIWPIVLLIIAIQPEVRFEGLIHALSLAISFRMIGSGEVELHVEELGKGSAEVGGEKGSTIRDDVGRDAMFGKDME